MKRTWLFILLYAIAISIQAQSPELGSPAIPDDLSQDTQPWWSTTWAYAGYWGAGIMLCFLFFRFKIKRIRSAYQLLVEKKEAARLAEIERIKTDFFFTITHELRTPLILIVEQLRQVLPQLKDPEVKEKVALAEKGSQQLLALVNQMLHLATFENRSMKWDIQNPISPAVFAGKEEELPMAEGGEPLVLIIEDNKDLRAYIREALSDHYQVAEAADGIEGLKKAMAWIPDIVISDLMIPGKDGISVCEELKSNQLTAHIPVILLTGKNTLDSKIEGLHAGADDYLVKPFYTEELLARMANLIENRRLVQAKFSTSMPHTEAMAGKAAEDSFSKADREFLQQLNALLEDHLEEEGLTIEDVAGRLYVSRVQLHRKLKALTGQPANEFIRNYRLDRALDMLKKQEGNVSQIAVRTGFKSQKYFSVRFKERFGISPSEV
ncbi:MAG: response regulator [Saprospiraceae bacterium]|nr:response regulator [Saprospiraceae bacterium]